MKTKRSQEGLVEVDHRGSPGLPPQFARTTFPEVPFELLGADTSLAAPTIRCEHCHAIVVINPARTRERAWCRACDAYICDACGAAAQSGAPHKTFEQIIAEEQERQAQLLAVSQI